MADNVIFYDPLLVNTETNKVSLEKENKFLAKAKRWKNLSIHRGKQSLISNYYEACTYPDVALGNDLNTPSQTDNSGEEDNPQLSTGPSCTPPGRGTGNSNTNTEQGRLKIGVVQKVASPRSWSFKSREFNLSPVQKVVLLNWLTECKKLSSNKSFVLWHRGTCLLTLRLGLVRYKPLKAYYLMSIIIIYFLGNYFFSIFCYMYSAGFNYFEMKKKTIKFQLSD